MEISEASLNAWARTCERLRAVTREALEFMKAEDAEEAVELIEYVYVAVMVLGNEMQQAGAARPARLPAPPPIPSRLLSSEANWRYARALRPAYEAAAAVDRERGWGDTGPAQVLKMLLTDVELQVIDPQRLGGRRASGIGSGRE